MPYPLKVRSRHSCHHSVAGVECPNMAVLRMGSRTNLGKRRVHINRPDRIRNAADKQRTHELFDAAGIKCAPWQKVTDERRIKTPLVAKHRFGSRGTGVYLLRTKADIDKFRADHSHKLDMFIYEKFKPYKFEYRMHVWSGGCFYACRKALKSEAPAGERWKRNDESCVWFRDDNREKFKRPETWDAIVAECVRALEVLELDVAGFDVRVSKDGKFFIVEVNSAPAFGDVTSQRYRQILPEIVRHIKSTRGLEVY